MQYRHFFICATAAMFALALPSCSNSDYNKEKEAEQTAEAPSIDVAMPEIDTVTIHKSFPCYLSANMEVDLVARVDGYLLSAPYKAGDFVKKGTVLFNIESSKYADAVNQAVANLNTAKATYDYASRNYEAMKKALESDAVSQMEVIQAKSNMETAKASIVSSEAALSSARTTLSYCKVLAPFDGHVSNSPYNPGAYLSGSGSPVTLGKIYEDDIVTVQFSIDEAELSSILNNGSRELKTDLAHIPVSFGDTLRHTYTADLSYMAPAVNRSTGQINVQAHIKNEWGELRSGMVGTIQIPDKVVPNGILIEDSSIAKDQLGNYVYVVDKDNKVVYTPIKVGELVTPTKRLVTSGLQPGDRYVTKALLKVRDGMTVKPVLTK